MLHEEDRIKKALAGATFVLHGSAFTVVDSCKDSFDPDGAFFLTVNDVYKIWSNGKEFWTTYLSHLRKSYQSAWKQGLIQHRL